MADSKLDYITEKLDNVSEKVTDIDTKLQIHIIKFDEAIKDNIEDRKDITRNTDILQDNTKNLAEHMKRTELLENYIKLLESRFTPVEMETVRKKAIADWTKERLVLLAKIGGALSALGAIGAAVKLLISHLS